MKPVRSSILVLSLAVLVTGALGAQGLTVLAEENPPFNTAKAGAPEGAATDLFLAMVAKAGIKLGRTDVQTTPWARAYDAAQAGPSTILFPMARTAARESLFKWVGPIYKVQIGLIAPKAKGFKFASVQEAATRKIGTVRDGAPEQALIAAGVQAAVLDREGDLLTNLRKLQAGRIELFAFNATAASYNMAALGMNPADYEVVWVLSSPELYFAFSKDIPDATVAALQTALDGLKKTGEYEAIIKKFVK